MTAEIYRLKIVLQYSKPVIWRRVLVKSDIKLSKLSEIILTVMGWSGGHLHGFRVKEQYYLDLDNFEDRPTALDERETRLCDVVGCGKYFIYDYDFGDGWQHSIRVEAVLKPEWGVKYPVCTAGAMACPPDDIGGMGGYEDFLKALKNPKSKKNKELIEWHGGEDFDPAELNLEEINEALHLPKESQ